MILTESGARAERALEPTFFPISKSACLRVRSVVAMKYTSSILVLLYKIVYLRLMVFSLSLSLSLASSRLLNYNRWRSCSNLSDISSLISERPFACRLRAQSMMVGERLRNRGEYQSRVSTRLMTLPRRKRRHSFAASARGRNAKHESRRSRLRIIPLPIN